MIRERETRPTPQPHVRYSVVLIALGSLISLDAPQVQALGHPSVQCAGDVEAQVDRGAPVDWVSGTQAVVQAKPRWRFTEAGWGGMYLALSLDLNLILGSLIVCSPSPRAEFNPPVKGACTNGPRHADWIIFSARSGAQHVLHGHLSLDDVQRERTPLSLRLHWFPSRPRLGRMRS